MLSGLFRERWEQKSGERHLGTAPLSHLPCEAAYSRPLVHNPSVAPRQKRPEPRKGATRLSTARAKPSPGWGRLFFAPPTAPCSFVAAGTPAATAATTAQVDGGSVRRFFFSCVTYISTLDRLLIPISAILS